MGEAATVSASQPARHQRRLRNYLLDRHFQLKYSSYLVMIALVLGASLGAVLWQTSQQLLSQSQHGVTQGERIVALGKEVVAESRKVSAVVQMNIIKDPVYSDNPALLEAFKSDSSAQDKRLKTQQDQLVAQASGLREQSAALVGFQRTLLLTLAVGLLLFVFLVGIAGIVVTHKVAGPIHKMKRQLNEVGKGHFPPPGRLRRGDELVEFFESFEKMVQRLRERQKAQLEQLDRAVQKLEEKGQASELEPLYELRERMRALLETA